MLLQINFTVLMPQIWLFHYATCYEVRYMLDNWNGCVLLNSPSRISRWPSQIHFLFDFTFLVSIYILAKPRMSVSVIRWLEQWHLLNVRHTTFYLSSLSCANTGYDTTNDFQQKTRKFGYLLFTIRFGYQFLLLLHQNDYKLWKCDACVC